MMKRKLYEPIVSNNEMQIKRANVINDESSSKLNKPFKQMYKSSLRTMCTKNRCFSIITVVYKLH